MQYLFSRNALREYERQDESIIGQLHSFTAITKSTKDEFKDLQLNMTFIEAQVFVSSYHKLLLLIEKKKTNGPK